MKKIIAILLTFVLVFAFAACTEEEKPAGNNVNEVENNTELNKPEENKPEENKTEAKGEGVMTYAEYAAAELEAPVVIEAYVQATQSWWDNKITVYAQDENGAYFIYEMACSEEDAAKLVKGAKIKVTGYKAEWAGEVEIIDATFELLEGNWVAEATDVTSLLGTEELIANQNKFVSFKGMTVENITYKNDEPGDDIYVDVSLNGNLYSFCIERYLTDPETEVYKTVQTLNKGDKVDIEGFLYWYNGVNTHMTNVTVVAKEVKGEGVMTYAEYAAAELETPVVIEAYVQATQSWWDNKITVYAQDHDGAYFIYELACSEEDAAKLVKGAKIKVTGHKAEWAGEVEIIDATFEILEGNWIAPVTDVTALLGTEELIASQNKFVSFKGMTVENVTYKNDEPGDDIYVDVSLNGATYSFCIERYLTDPETDVYKTVQTLKTGDKVDIEGFLYWYNGVNTHITGVTVLEAEAEAPVEEAAE